MQKVLRVALAALLVSVSTILIGHPQGTLRSDNPTGVTTPDGAVGTRA